MNDPYKPPPRYRERSGALVRYAIIGALLAGGVWAYMNFDQSGPSLVASEEEMVADSGFDTTAPAPEAAPAAPMEATPANPTEPASAPRSAPQPAQNTPPPSTTIGAPPSG